MGDDMDYDEYGFMFDDPDYIYAEESWDLAVCIILVPGYLHIVTPTQQTDSLTPG